MDWTTYLFRFDGRINRARFWIGVFYMLCAMAPLILLGALLSSLSGGDGSFDLNLDDVFMIVDPATYRLAPPNRLPLAVFKLGGTALLLWVYLALSVKRLHDRDRSAWWMMPFFVLPGLYSQFEDRLPDSYWILPLALAACVISLWGFIEMGFLRGTPRANRFGPDPLEKLQTRPRGGATSAPHADGWDQQSALEFVPHSASPPDGMHVKRGA
jgi:uncharacterized membrane protein YhaH (DUF805 family)